MEQLKIGALEKGHTEDVVDAIRAHEALVHDWEFRHIAVRVNRLYDQLNVRYYDGRLPKALIGIGPDLIVRYGYYHMGRDEIGAKHRIHLNSRHFGRSESDVGVTLLHEMIHVWQHLFGKPGSRLRDHNKEFTDVAASLGIRSQPKNGVTLGVSQELRRVLEGYGFSEHRPMINGGNDQPIRRPVRKKRLRCQCGSEVWAGSEDSVMVLCARCGSFFKHGLESQSGFTMVA